MRFEDISLGFTLIFVIVLQPLVVTGQCKRDPNPDFYTKRGSYFRNHVTQELTADQEYVCRIKCYRGDSCMSYNYKTTTGRCEINDSDEHQHPQDLVLQDDNIYGGTQRFIYVVSGSCGCFYLIDMPCDRALGMTNGGITDAQVKASSYYATTLAPRNARLHLQSVSGRRGGWAAAGSRNGQWIQVDLLAKAEVTGIATQGLSDLDQWVKTYSIQHSDEGTTFTVYNSGEVLTGNADRNTIVKHNLKQFSARFVRVLPKSWYNWIAMRLELYGCNPGQCNRDPNPEFYTKSGSYFRNHVIQELTADQEYLCRIKCYRGDSCMSYNYKTSTGRCEINDSDEHQHPQDLVLQDDNIYGDMPCDGALGMEDGRITNSQVNASSFYSQTLAPWNARLHLKYVPDRRRGWAAAEKSNGQWLQVDLRAKAEVTAIATQGLDDRDQWVKTYSIQHSDDGTMFTDYNAGEVLTGNADSNTTVKHNLKQFSARFVRVLPKSWQSHIAMRLELYGCNPGPF
ncbi:hypothetical protein QZH41_016838 [Actinostola sp. cb2023]|nr:hypothetical protein QZH41_016838 [Actinostola sp. cb2023]